MQEGPSCSQLIRTPAPGPPLEGWLARPRGLTPPTSALSCGLCPQLGCFL